MTYFLDIVTKVRNLIGDNLKSSADVFTYTVNPVFTLFESNVEEVSDVLVNAVSSGVAYVFNADTKKVTVSSTLRMNDLVEVEYSYFTNFSNTEINSYINVALDYLTLYYKTFIVESGNIIMPDMTIEEQSLLAIVTSILINPDNKTISIPDFRIRPSENESTDKIISRYVGNFKKRGCPVGIFGVIEK